VRTGDEAAQVPDRPARSDLCKRIVNNAIRMFINDAPPPNGWRWLRPIAQLDLWPTIAENASNKIATSSYSAAVLADDAERGHGRVLSVDGLRTIVFNDGASKTITYISHANLRAR
jgi:hypothetical protein